MSNLNKTVGILGYKLADNAAAMVLYGIAPMDRIEAARNDLEVAVRALTTNQILVRLRIASNAFETSLNHHACMAVANWCAGVEAPTIRREVRR